MNARSLQERRDALGSWRASRLSQSAAAASIPLNRFSCWAPVGLVTLISVSQSPITSMPTKIRPRRFSSGPMAAQISRSRAVRSTGSATPPTRRFDRTAPFIGTRLIAPTGSPSIRMMRLSPASTAGRNFWITSGSRDAVAWISIRAPRFGSPAFSLTTPEPAAPCSGFSTTSP